MKAAKSIVLAILLGISVASSAQPTAAQMSARWERLASEIGLDAAQTETFLAVMKTQDEKMRTYHEEMKTNMDALKAETLSELSDTLTADQLQQLDKALTRPAHGMAPPRRF